jgi:hypothetical protein
MKRFRISLARVMAIVAVVAVDCAMIAPGYFDSGLIAVVPILQVGLFRMVRSRGGLRLFWVGFEAFGWSGTLAYYVLRRPIWGYLSEVHPYVLSLLPARHHGSYFNGYVFIVEILLICIPLVMLALIGGCLTENLARSRRLKKVALNNNADSPTDVAIAAISSATGRGLGG